VRIFTDEACCLRLSRALAVETHEEWIDANRYLTMEPLRELLKKTTPERKAA
jgi:putative transposase